MGGYEGGEVASSLVLETVESFFAAYAKDADLTWPFALEHTLAFTGNMIRAAVHLAHKRVINRRKGALAQMGSTVAMLVLREGRAFIGHIGDSRIYRLRGGALEALTRDHSLVEQMRDMNPSPEDGLSPELMARYKNILTRAVGIPEQDGLPEVNEIEVQAGDTFLLCTDGLLEGLGEDQILPLLQHPDPEAASEALTRAAYHQGSKDNITTLVLRVAA